jgi:hypothetical protein
MMFYFLPCVRSLLGQSLGKAGTPLGVFLPLWGEHLERGKEVKSFVSPYPVRGCLPLRSSLKGGIPLRGSGFA